MAAVASPVSRGRPRYVFGRLVALVLTLLAVATFTFALTFALPRDAARTIVGPKASDDDYRQARARLGLDDPLIVQYGRYVERIARGDLGYSYVQRRPVADILRERVPNTMLLAVVAMVIQLTGGIGIGLAAAARPGGPLDRITLGAALVLVALPAFWVGLVLLYLFLPVFVVVAFSFNDPVGRFNFSWSGFTLDSWRDPCSVPGMCDAVVLSLQIGVIATVVATLLGTLLAFGLVRHSFRGRAGTSLLVFLPMATPEVVMGASLLTLFVNAGVATGFWTIVVAHILFTVSFVVVTVKARLAGFDSRLEEAAMDLYADEWQTFRRITLPLAAPGIFAGALLAFALSFDDFIITNFNSGNTITFPMYVWGAAQRGVPPEVNVIGTAMFLLALLLVGGAEVVRKVRTGAAAG